MGDWKNTEWQKKLKNKPVRYWIRDEIEEIIKEKNIDRLRFCECSKFTYYDIIKKFHFTFVDYEKQSKISLSYCWLHLRKDLKVINTIYEQNYDWIAFLKKIQSLMPTSKDNKLYMILSEEWVYEGFADEIFNVLAETDSLLEDFYIVSKKFDWFTVYSSDACSAVLYHK